MSDRQSISHILTTLQILSDPDAIAGCDRYVLANMMDQAHKWLNSSVFVLTRSGEHGILGLYRTRALAEKARDQCFDPDEMRIDAFLVEDEVEDE